jgi:D-tyrosyl-tRNA(Tyr) deacylase
MKAVAQRSLAAKVTVDDEIVGAIDRGLVVFAGLGDGDQDADLDWMAKKLVELRIFQDDLGKMSRSVKDTGGGLLLVSQFTLFGDTSRGNRPSFTGAMAPDQARTDFDRFVAKVRALHPIVATGRFAADMRVSVENDGPVTILLDSRSRSKT